MAYSVLPILTLVSGNDDIVKSFQAGSVSLEEAVLPPKDGHAAGPSGGFLLRVSSFTSTSSGPASDRASGERPVCGEQLLPGGRGQDHEHLRRAEGLGDRGRDLVPVKPPEEVELGIDVDPERTGGNV